MSRVFWVFLSLSLYAGVVMAIEEPGFELIEQVDAFELRDYNPYIIAEVLVSGDLDDASSKGFKLIAGYIFGDNQSKTGGEEKIRMTAPVTIEAASEKISMTAPVTMEETEGQWRMFFVMPSSYTMETLPTPNNDEVRLKEIAGKKMAVIRFSGFTGEEKIAKKTKALNAWMESKSIKAIGNPEIARYNPPWTLPFLRRNEVMIEFQYIKR